jgi:regulator of replication initiation timing
LKPQIPKQIKNLIPKELYDDQVKQNDILTKQIDGLNTQLNDLTSQLSDFQSQVTNEINNRLNIEQTNDALVNQLNSLKQTIDDFVKQIQSAVQKSVDESILRASLQAQNVGLKSQIEGLINDSDVYDFYLKYRNDIDELLSKIKFYDEVPSEITSFSLYDYVIKGTKKAISEIITMIIEESKGTEEKPEETTQSSEE